MKKIIVIFFLIFIVIKCTDYDYTEEYFYNPDTEDLINERVAKYWKNYEIRQRITECIVYYSAMYSLDPLFVARLFEIESSFRYNKVNTNTGCRGLGQVDPTQWAHLLYYIDNGELGRYLKKKNITNKQKLYSYFDRIGYGTQTSCKILRHYLDAYEEDLIKTMYVYSGNRTAWARRRPWLWENYSNKIFS